MASIDFVAHETVVPATWLNEIDRTQHDILGNPSNAADIRTAISVDSSAEVTAKDDAILADLASTDAGKGAALIGLEQGGTVQDGIRYWTPQMFGWSGSGDPTTYVQAAVDAMAVAGGEVVLPPGTYEFDTAGGVIIDGDAAFNQRLIGYGSILKSGSNVTGPLISVINRTVPNRVVLEGFTIDHADNANPSAGIYLERTGGCIVSRVSFVLEDNKADYAAILVGPETPGSNTTNCFWTTIEHCFFRPYSGGGAKPAYCIRLLGAANATNIIGNHFNTGAIAIGQETDGVGDALANGLLIEGNHFEGVDTCVGVVAIPTTGFWPVGLRILSNRVESATTFVSFTTDGGGAANDHSHPPIIGFNYLVSGSITNVVLNTENARHSYLDPSYSGQAAGWDVMVNGDAQMRMSGNFIIRRQTNSASATYEEGHLVMGPYHLWVDTTGDLRIKNGAPSSDTDGTIVGTQS